MTTAVTWDLRAAASTRRSWSLNRNKRSLVLDLTKAEAGEVFARLVETSDVLITNIREPALSKLGVAYEQVRRHRDDIIWVGVTAFGPDGPYAGRPGIDFLAQGYAGLLSLNGHPDGAPVRVTVPMVDTMTSLTVCTGVLAALRVRETTGDGQRIDVSLLDVLIHAQASGLGAYALTRRGHPAHGQPQPVLRALGHLDGCRDGKGIVITCPVGEVLPQPVWRARRRGGTRDTRFGTSSGTGSRTKMSSRAPSWPSVAPTFDRDDLLARLVAADVLTAPINEIPDVVSDPQVRHNEMIVPVEHATLGKLNVTAPPLHMHRTPASVRLAPPVLGQHSEEILAELGYDADEVAGFAADAIIGVRRNRP